MDNTLPAPPFSAPIEEKGHPKGLYVLFATEMWERFNYYGMRAVLVLFMTKALLFDKVFASNLYGSYTSLAYLTSLAGGYIADRYWGNKRSIIAGGLVMATGEFLLFFCGTFYHSAPVVASVLFYSGLGFVITGFGFFKPNISSLVGQLYSKNDRRKDSAYTIFYMGINVGAAIGPLICGYFGDTGNPADFKWAFLVAGIGMLISVVVQKMFQTKYVVDPQGKPLGETPQEIPAILLERGQRDKVPAISKNWLNPFFMAIGLVLMSCMAIALLYIDAKIFSYLSFFLVACFALIALFLFLNKGLTRVEKTKIGVIFIVSFFVIFFWAAFEQAGASLTFFAEEQTQRQVGSFTVPASWFQSVNSMFLIVFAPIFGWLWLKMGKREPSSPTKMAMGLFFLALGYLWIAFGVKNVAPSVKVSMIWLTGMYLLHTWGELCLSPIGLSLVNKMAPLKFASLLMAVWFLANAVANKLAGVLSGLYPDHKTTHFFGFSIHNMFDFFMIFVFIAGMASLILFLLTNKLQQMMKAA